MGKIGRQRSCASTEKAEKCVLWHNVREGVTQKRGRLQEECRVQPSRSALMTQKL